jgi:hypothetical protein
MGKKQNKNGILFFPVKEEKVLPKKYREPEEKEKSLPHLGFE